MMKTFDLYELTYKESKTSLDMKTSRDKLTFNMVKRYKKKGYTEGNAAMAQKRLNIKYEQTESPSLVKTEIMFKQRSFIKMKTKILGLLVLRMKLVMVPFYSRNMWKMALSLWRQQILMPIHHQKRKEGKI
jgi:hypothetical protein